MDALAHAQDLRVLFTPLSRRRVRYQYWRMALEFVLFVLVVAFGGCKKPDMGKGDAWIMAAVFLKEDGR